MWSFRRMSICSRPRRMALLSLLVVALGAADCRHADDATAVRAGALTISVHGTVRNNGGTAIAGAGIQLLVTGSGTSAGATTSAADGSYALSVQDGTYDIVVTPPAGGI